MRTAYIDEPPDLLAFLVSASSFDDLIDNVEFLERIGRAGSAGRAAGRAREDPRGSRAPGDHRDEEAPGRGGLGHRCAHRRGARGSRSTRSRPRPPFDRRVAEAERPREHAGDARGVPPRGRGARGRERVAGRADQGGAGRGGLRPAPDSRRLQGSSGRATGSSSAASGCAGGGCTRASTSDCPYGAPNRAAAAGTVIYAGWLGGYGNLVVVDHGNGLSTAYAHASAILVSVGQTVSQGETVSLVGATGHVDRAAPALRGADQRRRRRPAAVPVEPYRPRTPTRPRSPRAGARSS